ncbi:MAG: amidohydrolase [Candidatus Krumholzibacteriia bacterium]
MPILLDNAHVYTPSGAFERAALRIADGRIDAVIPAAALAAPAPPDAPQAGDGRRAGVIDLGGTWVLPGFVDTHIHLTSIALKFLRCDLSAAVSAADVAQRMRAWADARPGPHLMGVDWDEGEWENAALPSRSMLDGIEARRPVLARRVCGHVGVANSALLARLGESAARIDPALVDADSGLLREHALWEAGRVCAPEARALAARFEEAIRHLHSLGITAIHDIVGTDKFDTYLEGVTSSVAPLSIDVLLVTGPEDFGRYRAAVDGCGAANLRLAGIKCFLDGSLGGRTAAINDPYEDGGDRGVLLVDTDTLRATARACHEGGFTCAMHAIGDRAIDQATAVLRAFPPDADNFRIEHCELVGPTQLRALQEAPVFLSLQPNFVRRWGAAHGVYERRLGKARLARMNRFRSLLDGGVDFVFGSDGMPPGPLYGLRGATHHPHENERLTAVEAIDRYTRLAHAVGARRDPAGLLEAGWPADLVVLDKNPLSTDVGSIQVLMTMVAGDPVTPWRGPAGGAGTLL